jgi:hypothetical protein
MDDARQRAKAHARPDGQRDAVDHFTGMARNHSGTKNAVRILPDMYLDEPLRHAVRHRAVNVVHQDGEGSDRDIRFARVKRVKSDMGNLWVGIGAPRDHQSA